MDGSELEAQAQFSGVQGGLLDLRLIALANRYAESERYGCAHLSLPYNAFETMVLCMGNLF